MLVEERVAANWDPLDQAVLRKRPTPTFLYSSLIPHLIGRLITLHEHKVFTQGVVWGIDLFNQWGVELGNELAGRLVPIVSDKGASTGSWLRRPPV